MNQAAQTSNQKLFTGLSVALVTPFDDKEHIDLKSLEKLIEHIDKDADNLVLFGTTGESPTLSLEERRDMLRFVRERTHGRWRIILGLGSNDTHQLVHRVEDVDPDGIDGILSVVPYYSKPNERGIYKHFASVAEASPLPIVLYNIPSRTGVNLTVETLRRLRETYPEKIVAIKEASGSAIPERVAVLRDTMDSDFTILSGDDNLNLRAIKAGADGAVSVVANAFPRLSRATLQTEQGALAEQTDAELTTLYKLLFSEGNPTGIKALLHDMNLLAFNTLRLPLVSASEELYNQLKAESARLLHLAL